MEQYLGKKTCKTLKGIRRKIADANDIKYEPKECTHEGDCAGTCPACEAEVKYMAFLPTKASAACALSAVLWQTPTLLPSTRRRYSPWLAMWRPTLL